MAYVRSVKTASGATAVQTLFPGGDARLDGLRSAGSPRQSTTRPRRRRPSATPVSACRRKAVAHPAPPIRPPARESRIRRRPGSPAMPVVSRARLPPAGPVHGVGPLQPPSLGAQADQTPDQRPAAEAGAEKCPKSGYTPVFQLAALGRIRRFGPPRLPVLSV